MNYLLSVCSNGPEKGYLDMSNFMVRVCLPLTYIFSFSFMTTETYLKIISRERKFSGKKKIKRLNLQNECKFKFLKFTAPCRTNWLS